MSPKNRRRVPFGAYLNSSIPPGKDVGNNQSPSPRPPPSYVIWETSHIYDDSSQDSKVYYPLNSVGAPRHPTSLGVTEASHQHSSVSTWVLALQVGEICLLLLYKRLNSMVLFSTFRKSICPQNFALGAYTTGRVREYPELVLRLLINSLNWTLKFSKGPKANGCLGPDGEVFNWRLHYKLLQAVKASILQVRVQSSSSSR